MKIVSLWVEKGGCGKSTLSLMLAGCAASRGMKVLLVDEDPQASCALLAKDGALGFPVVTSFPTEQPDVDLVIVDMAPNTNTIPYGVVVMPYQPTRLSYEIAAKHIDFLMDKSEKLVEVVTMVDSRKKNHQDFIASSNALVVKSRSIYERVTNEGVTIFADSFKTKSGTREAKQEISALLNEVLK